MIWKEGIRLNYTRQATQTQAANGLNALSSAVLRVLQDCKDWVLPHQISEMLNIDFAQDPLDRVDRHAIIHGILVQLMVDGKVEGKISEDNFLRYWKFIQN